MDLSFLEEIMPTILSVGMNLIWSIIYLIIGLKVVKVLRKIVHQALEKSKIDTGVVQFLDMLVKFAAYAVLILTMLARFGIETTSFITILGSAGVAIGLSLQGSLSNFAGGILILVLRPFKVGDYISAKGLDGTVSEISIFSTTLRTPDNKNIVIPNGTLSNSEITNYSSHPTRRLDMEVGIAYGSDLKKAQEVVKKILDADERILKDPAYTVAVGELGDSSIKILIRPWVNASDYWTVKWETLEKIHNTFKEESIEIPFPQLTVHMDK